MTVDKKGKRNLIIAFAAVAVLIGALAFSSFTVNGYIDNSPGQGYYQTEAQSALQDEDQFFKEVKPLYWGSGGSGGSSTEGDEMPGWLIAIIVICSVIIAAAIVAVIVVLRMYSKSEKQEKNDNGKNNKSDKQ